MTFILSLTANVERNLSGIGQQIKNLFNHTPHKEIGLMRGNNHIIPFMNKKHRSLKFEKTLEYNHTFERYLGEVESITHVPISDRQRRLLKMDIESNTYRRLSPDESHDNRREFNKVKRDMISEWEHETGRVWNTYDKDVHNKNGKIIRKAGSKYDAHELILNSWGSPHFWYNITPAPTPEHQRDIHGKNSVCEQIFGKR